MKRGYITSTVILMFIWMIILFNSFMAEASRITEKYYEYEHQGQVMEAFAAWDGSMEGKRPGVIVVHEWNGINPQILEKCRMLAEFGYLAFAADIYGKGIRPETREESARQAGIYRKNRELMRGRANAALTEIRKLPQVDGARIATMGYCFGGGVALEHARSGADIKGAVSFHGNLDTPDPADAENIQASVLVLHGAADPYVPMEQVMDFSKEMEEGGVDWQLVMYGHAVHSFTNPEAGNDPSRGSAYDSKANRRSWEAMMLFFQEIFR